MVTIYTTSNNKFHKEYNIANLKMKFLRIQRLCLKSIGYSFRKNESRTRRIFALWIWMGLLVIAIPEWHFVIENIADIPLATDALCPLLTTILSLSKVMTLYFKKDKFYNVIEQLDDMWQKSKLFMNIFLL